MPILIPTTKLIVKGLVCTCNKFVQYFLQGERYIGDNDINLNPRHPSLPSLKAGKEKVFPGNFPIRGQTEFLTVNKIVFLAIWWNFQRKENRNWFLFSGQKMERKKFSFLQKLETYSTIQTEISFWRIACKNCAMLIIRRLHITPSKCNLDLNFQEINTWFNFLLACTQADVCIFNFLNLNNSVAEAGG